MKRLNLGCIALVLVSGLAATAYAEDAPAPAPAPAMAPASHPLVGPALSYYTSVGVASSPTWGFGVSFGPGITLELGAQFLYNGNGLASSATTGIDSNKFAFRSFLYGAYYFYNKFPVAIGVEAAVETGFAPKAFDTVTFAPGIAFVYAPFNAPILLGTGIDIQITSIDGAKSVIQSVEPGLRITYAF
jgi:hypothetical protein